MIKIYCVKVGELYGWEYVARLAAMFKRCLHLPYTFVCCTDSTADAPVLSDGRVVFTSPRRKCKGWWNLQEAYSNPDWAEGQSVFYVGLDTIITRDITSYLEERISADRLTLMHDFSCINPGTPNELFVNTWADGAAFIPRGGVPVLWHEFLQRVGPESSYPMHVFNTEVLRDNGITPDLWQDLYPDFLCSYKWPTVKMECPPEAVMCFHGEPRPIQAAEETPWIKEYWRE